MQQLRVNRGTAGGRTAAARRGAAAAQRPVAAAQRRQQQAPPARQRRQQQQQQQQQQAQQQQPKLASVLGAAALSLGLMFASPALPPAHAGPQALADLVRDSYGFIDADADGVITIQDLQAFNSELIADEGVPSIGEGQLEFSLKLFDLNQDGTLTSEELLRSLALDGAVSDDAVDEGVFKVFDANNNGRVEADEWQRGLGDLGPDGEGAKRYIFNRVDRLTDSKHQLDASDFGTALVLARTVILGY